jgi:hypothetical protein
MRRALVAALLLAAGTAGCQYDVTLAPGATPVSVRIGDGVAFDWNGFRVQLDPTVMVWADEAHVDFRGIVRGALGRVEGALHGTPVPITISAGSYLPIPDVGIGGMTDRRTGEVRIAMDSRSPTSVSDFLTQWVPIALAHELHHAKRILNGPGYGTTLLDAIVTEGSAEAFVRETYPQAPSIPWVQPLTRADKTAVWHRLRPLLSEPDDIDVHQAWFVGGGALPSWPGYRIGYEIARRYLTRHPGSTAAELALLPAQRIFAGSGFVQEFDRKNGVSP